MKKISMMLAAVQVFLCMQIPAMAEDIVIQLEAENYSTISTKMNITEGQFSNGKDLEWAYSAPSETDEYLISYDFEVPKNGLYELKGVANVRGQGHTTDWSVYVNTEDNAPTDYSKISDVECSNWPSIMKEYSMGKFRLKKGKNTLYVKANKNDTSTVAPGIMFVMLDYFSFDKAEDAPFALDKTEFQGSKVGVFDEGTSVKLDFLFTSPAPEPVSYRFKIQDVYERNVSEGTFTTEKGKDEATLDFGTFKIGWYRVYLYENNSERPMNKYISFAVTKPLSKRAKFDDTVFASDIGYASVNDDYANAFLRAGFGYLRGRGSSAYAGGDPAGKRIAHQYGLNEIADHDGSAVLSSLGGINETTKPMTFDLYEHAYKVWRDTPAANGNYEEAEEVLNEIDLGMWGVTATAENWTAYYKAAAIGVYDGNPNTKKMFGGFAGYTSRGGIIEQILQNDILSYSDAYNYHAHSEFETRPQLAKMSSVAYSKDSKLPLWGTEVGYPQKFKDGETMLTNDQMKNEARGAITTGIIQLANGSNKNFWFLGTPYLENNQNFACFSSPESLPFPSYSALSTMSDVLGQGIIKGELAGLSDGTTGYLFDDGQGNDAAVLWSGQPGYYSVRANEITYVDMVGYEEKKTDTDGDGIISVYISPNPCFIKFKGRSAAENYYPMEYAEEQVTKAFEPNERIILQPIWPSDDLSNERLNGYAYKNGQEVEIKLNVYNLNDMEITANLTVDAEDIIQFEETEQSITLAPWEKKELVLKAKVSDAVNPGTKGMVKFSGTTGDGGEISRVVSKVQVSNLNRTVEQKDIVPFENIWDVKKWNLGNVSTGGKVYMTGNEKENTASFEVDNAIWHYPQFKIDDPEKMSESAGIVYDVQCAQDKEAYMGIGTFIHMKDGRQYYCGYAATHDFSTEWQQVVLPWSTFYLYSSPLGAVDTRKFEFKDVASISIGDSTGVGNTPAYTVKNFGYFYSDNPGDKLTEEDSIEFSGMEEGKIYHKGDQIILKAKMPENEYINYKVFNRSEPLENYTVENGEITMDFSNFDRGAYWIIVTGETNMNLQIFNSFKFYIE